MNAVKSNLLLRNPSFAKVWMGQILSQSCGRMFQIAIVWWLLSAAPSNPGGWVGAFMVMGALPSLLFVRFIGRVIDTASRKNILICADSLAFAFLAVLGALVSLMWVSPISILIASFLAATLQAFIDPTLNKAVNEVTTPDDREVAIGLLASTQSIASFSGAILGAMLISHLGVGGTVGLAALGYLLSALATSFARFTDVEMTHSEGAEGLLETETGWALLSGFPLLKKVLLGFAGVNFFATPLLVVLPIYVKSVLQMSASALGLLEACVWFGLILGSWGAGYLAPSGKFGLLQLAALCLGAFGLALAVPGFIVNAYVYGGALLVAGFFLGVNNVKFMNYFQATVAGHLKGRFFALMQATISATFPIAYFLFGALTDFIPVMTVCIAQAAGVLVMSGYFLALSRGNQLSQPSGEVMA